MDGSDILFFPELIASVFTMTQLTYITGNVLLEYRRGLPALIVNLQKQNLFV